MRLEDDELGDSYNKQISQNTTLLTIDKEPYK